MMLGLEAQSCQIASENRPGNPCAHTPEHHLLIYNSDRTGSYNRRAVNVQLFNIFIRKLQLTDQTRLHLAPTERPVNKVKVAFASVPVGHRGTVHTKKLFCGCPPQSALPRPHKAVLIHPTHIWKGSTDTRVCPAAINHGSAVFPFAKVLEPSPKTRAVPEPHASKQKRPRHP